MKIDTPIKIFLSHPSDEYTEKVKDILERVPIQKELYIFPNYDKLELDFVDAIQQTIEEVDLFMVILNKKGRSKQWVNQEVGVAVAKEKDIVVLAEQEAIDKKKLEGFINEKNRTIIAIDKDDSEEKLIQWLKKYTEEHEMIFLQRVILTDINELRRIVSAKIFKCEEEPGSINLKQEYINVEAYINRVLRDFNEHGFFSLSELSLLKDSIDALQATLYTSRGKTIRTPKDFITSVDKRELLLKLVRYIELRKIEY